jgi:acyl-CoA synthetase (AMP-forming)/AMP-acid ligase II
VISPFCSADTLSFNALAARADAFAVTYAVCHRPGQAIVWPFSSQTCLQVHHRGYGALKAGLVIVNANPQSPLTKHVINSFDSVRRRFVVLDKLGTAGTQDSRVRPVELLIGNDQP